MSRVNLQLKLLGMYCVSREKGCFFGFASMQSGDVTWLQNNKVLLSRVSKLFLFQHIFYPH